MEENCRSERSVCNKRRFLEAFRPIGKEMLDVRSLDGTQKIYKLDVLFISMSHDIIQRFNGRPVVLRLFASQCFLFVLVFTLLLLSLFPLLVPLLSLIVFLYRIESLPSLPHALSPLRMLSAAGPWQVQFNHLLKFFCLSTCVPLPKRTGIYFRMF